MSDRQRDEAEISAVLQDYFDGLYEGDVEKLRRIFHADTWLKGSGLRISRDDWLDAVASRPIPKEEGLKYDFEILTLDIVNDHAMVKANVPLLAARYVDFLGLLKEEGRWKIVNKTFTTT